MTDGGTPPSPRTAQDVRGRARLLVGGAFGVSGAVIGIVLPVVFLLGGANLPGGSASIETSQIDLLSALLAAGVLLLLVSFFAYRFAFSALRKVEPRFWVASALCLVGSLGLVILLVAAVVVGGSAGAVSHCISGSPSHALSCLRSGSSGELLGANLAVLGFWLAWIGGVGIVVGLGLEGQRIRAPTLSGAAAVYALALVVLVGPFASLFLTFPGATDLLLAIPVLAIVGPALVIAGSRRR